MSISQTLSYLWEFHLNDDFTEILVDTEEFLESALATAQLQEALIGAQLQ